MARRSKQILETFDFAEALSLFPEERMRRSVAVAEERLRDEGLLGNADIPPIPPGGGSEEELAGLQRDLGVALPEEYAPFLRQRRYLNLDSAY